MASHQTGTGRTAVGDDFDADGLSPNQSINQSARSAAAENIIASICCALEPAIASALARTAVDVGLIIKEASLAASVAVEAAVASAIADERATTRVIINDYALDAADAQVSCERAVNALFRCRQFALRAISRSQQARTMSRTMSHWRAEVAEMRADAILTRMAAHIAHRRSLTRAFNVWRCTTRDARAVSSAAHSHSIALQGQAQVAVLSAQVAALEAALAQAQSGDGLSMEQSSIEQSTIPRPTHPPVAGLRSPRSLARDAADAVAGLLACSSPFMSLSLPVPSASDSIDINISAVTMQEEEGGVMGQVQVERGASMQFMYSERASISPASPSLGAISTPSPRGSGQVGVEAGTVAAALFSPSGADPTRELSFSDVEDEGEVGLVEGNVGRPITHMQVSVAAASTSLSSTIGPRTHVPMPTSSPKSSPRAHAVPMFITQDSLCSWENTDTSGEGPRGAGAGWREGSGLNASEASDESAVYPRGPLLAQPEASSQGASNPWTSKAATNGHWPTAGSALLRQGRNKPSTPPTVASAGQAAMQRATRGALPAQTRLVPSASRPTVPGGSPRLGTAPAHFPSSKLRDIPAGPRAGEIRAAARDKVPAMSPLAALLGQNEKSPSSLRQAKVVRH